MSMYVSVLVFGCVYLYNKIPLVQLLKNSVSGHIDPKYPYDNFPVEAKH